MRYFRKFPLFVAANRTEGSTKKTVVMADFFRRVSTGVAYANLNAFLIPYLVRDGESIESVAYNFYGNAGYHWVIILMNQITDPREEWPLSVLDLRAKIYNDYPFVMIVPIEDYYSVGDELTHGDDTFVVSEVEAIDDLTQQISILSTSGFCLLTSADVLSNTTTEIDDLTIISIVGPEDGIHHYEQADGYTVDYDEQGVSEGTIEPITNAQHEESENDIKRQIRVLEPTYLQNFVRDFETELNR